jgi:hypothetical protein
MNSREDPDNIQGKSPQKAGDMSRHQEWREWADALRRYQLDGIATWLLDAGRPMALLSAQMLHIGAPFMGGTAGRLASVLESDEWREEMGRLLEQGGARAPEDGRGND